MSILFSNKKFYLLLSLLIFSFYKSPYIFLNGRFLAEEGSYWFRNTYLNGYFEGITQIFVGSGYFNLWPNIASVFANLVPLSYAPLVTVYFAFSIKILLFLYILFQQSELMEKNTHKFLTALIVIFAPTMVAEIWLNTLTSQVYFTILSSLILFQINNKNFYTKFSPVVLFFSSLSSITTCILTPFFFMKYFKNKDKINFYNLVVISFGSLIQFSIYFYIRFNNLEWLGSNERYILSFYKLLNYFYNVIFKSFLGTPFTKFLYFTSRENIYLLILLILIFLLLLIYIIKSIRLISKDKVSIVLIILFLIQSILAIYAGKDNHVQGRFACIPSIMLLFLTLRIFFLKTNLKFIFGCLIFMTVCTGVYEFRDNNKYLQLLTCIDCPDWNNEVNKWEKNKDYKLRIWDYTTNKTMSLVD